MPRRFRYRERADQPQGLVEPAQLQGLRTTFLHAPSMGVHEAVRGARRNGVLGAGIDVRGINGDLAYRFNGTHGNGGCSWGTTPTCFGATAILYVARFRLAALGGNIFARWGAGNATFLIATDAAGDFVLAAANGTSSQGGARKTIGFGLSVGRTVTIAVAAQSSSTAPNGITASLDGRPLDLPGNVYNNGTASAFNDGPQSIQIGVANDGGPMSGWVSFVAQAIGNSGAISQAMLNSVSANPWQMAEATRRFVNPAAAITVYRPGSDVAVSGWTAVGAATRAAALADESGATYAESPDLSTPDTQTWTPPFPAGPASLEITAARTAGVGALRIVFLDAGGAVVGTTAWQALTGAPADYTLTATVLAISPQFRIEVQP
jgi:hypothetical protein